MWLTNYQNNSKLNYYTLIHQIKPDEAGALEGLQCYSAQPLNHFKL